MEETVSMLSILFENGGARYEIEDGIVTKMYGLKVINLVSVPLPPREFFESWKERSVVDAINCSVFSKFSDESSPRGFRWELVERLDIESSDIVYNFVPLHTQRDLWEIGVERVGRIEEMGNGEVWVCLGGKRVRWESLKEQVETYKITR